MRDDWYFPDRLRLHADMLAMYGDLDFLTGDYEYRDTSDALIGRSLERHPSGRRILARAAGGETSVMEDLDFEEFVADHFGDMHTLSVPRTTFLQLGGYPKGFKVCEDVHFLIRLVSRSRRAGVVCRPLGVYLIHDASATRRDRLQSQRENVRTLLDLKRFESRFPRHVRRGFRRLLARARADLGYALIRCGQRRAAIRPGIESTLQSYPCGSLELAREVLGLVGRAPDPANAVVGLRNHGITATGPDPETLFERIAPRLEKRVPMADLEARIPHGDANLLHPDRPARGPP